MSGVLVVMGSGETTPTMVKLHRQLLERAGDTPARLLDTPYGFQENADDITARTVTYLRDAAGRTVTPLPWRTPDPGAADRAVAALRTSGWLLAGPGSPTYALRVWAETGFAEEVATFVRRGGVAVFSSAAALTLGTRTVPVYEVYKAGEDPHWRPGLDITGRLFGLDVVVVPHFDNREGGTHDTRYCYLGERRLARLEEELGPGEHVLGVDEHTALLLDLAAGTATVWGNGTVTVRQHGHETVLPTDAVVPIPDLLRMLREHGAALPSAGGPGTVPDDTAPDDAARDDAAPDDATPGSLRRAADDAEAAFSAAIAARRPDEAVAAALELEAALEAWTADTVQGDARDHARRTLRSMLVRLGELAVEGARDPREAVGGFVALLLERRAAAREARDWATSDALRDGLAALGVEVRDTPAGATWALAERQ
jgi:cyanophycinase-like exopeptidase